jgi:hypothetical protein
LANGGGLPPPSSPATPILAKGVVEPPPQHRKIK